MSHRVQSLPWAVVAVLACGPAFAQSPAPTPAPSIDSVPEKIAPGAKPTEPAKNLSQELNKSNGVIRPKEVDPAIEKPVPKTGDPNIIKPPPPASAAPQPK